MLQPMSRILSVTMGVMILGLAAAARQADPVAVLTALNDDYIRFVQDGDVKGFERLLGDDFLCSNPDGSLVDKAAFLAQTARPVTIRDLRAHDVRVRVLGEVALVHARTTFTNADGSPGAGRYTDTYARRGGRWVAIAAHVTRLAPGAR
jgi:ketosteroid isomerase-like protein